MKSRYLTASLILIFSCIPAGNTQQLSEEQLKANDGRRLALSIPGERKSQASEIENKKTKSASLPVDPEAEFASKHHLKQNEQANQIPDNIKELLVDGAEKAELLSRSYNRRVADLIIWLANSMNKSTSYTPAQGPHLHRQQPLETHPLTSSFNKHASIFQID